MNGAITEDWLKIIKAPNKTKVIIKGNNQYFFRSPIKPQRSLRKSNIPSNI